MNTLLEELNDNCVAYRVCEEIVVFHSTTKKKEFRIFSAWAVAQESMKGTLLFALFRDGVK